MGRLSPEQVMQLVQAAELGLCLLLGSAPLSSTAGDHLSALCNQPGRTQRFKKMCAPLHSLQNYLQQSSYGSNPIVYQPKSG